MYSDNDREKQQFDGRKEVGRWKSLPNQNGSKRV